MSEQKLDSPEIELIAGSTYRIEHSDGNVTMISTGKHEYPYIEDTFMWLVEKSSGNDDLAISALKTFFQDMDEIAKIAAAQDMDDEFNETWTYEL